MRGRKPVPTNLKLLHGNPGKRALPTDEPVVPDAPIVCPEHLSPRAKVFWAIHQPILTTMRVLTAADVSALATLCETEAEYWDARADVAQNGTRLEVFDERGSKWLMNPSVNLSSDAFKRLKSMLVEFGMTPSSRSRISVKTKADEEDPFAQFERQA